MNTQNAFKYIFLLIRKRGCMLNKMLLGQIMAAKIHHSSDMPEMNITIVRFIKESFTGDGIHLGIRTILL